jgi:hypothetical protein
MSDVSLSDEDQEHEVSPLNAGAYELTSELVESHTGKLLSEPETFCSLVQEREKVRENIGRVIELPGARVALGRRTGVRKGRELRPGQCSIGCGRW